MAKLRRKKNTGVDIGALLRCRRNYLVEQLRGEGFTGSEVGLLFGISKARVFKILDDLTKQDQIRDDMDLVALREEATKDTKKVKGFIKFLSDRNLNKGQKK